MPVDRGVAVDLAQGLADLYADAQTRLAQDIARRLASGMTSPDWAEDKLRALGTLQSWTQTLLGRLASTGAAQAEQAVVLAYARGGTAAMAELRGMQLGDLERLALGQRVESMERLRRLAEARSSALTRELTAVRQALPGVDAMQRLAWSLHSRLQGTHLRILRWGLDAYRTVIAEAAAPQVLTGLATRRRAAQVAWERLLTQGVTGFVDRSGRRWELASYVEMASRTTVAQAAVEGHLDRLGDAGLDLVAVSDAPQECARCRPWEGKILARGGPGGRRTVELEHATQDGQQVQVDVAGSVDEAISAGLMHPNCRHSLSGYLPGVTRIPTDTEDPAGDKARQQLRYLERQVRAWKLKAAAAIDPAAAKAAAAKARDYQARIRAHVAATPGLNRQPGREQVGVAR